MSLTRAVAVHALRGCTRGLVLAMALLAPLQALASADCTFSATGPAFGLYDPLNASPTLANSSVSVTCTHTGGGATTTTMVALYTAGDSGTFPNRYMLSGTDRLYYNLYLDAALTQIGGDGTGGTQTGSASLKVSNGQPTATVTAVIYGRIPAGQSVPPGTYTDAILVTFNY
jgi:spore coat protein U-like protein